MTFSCPPPFLPVRTAPPKDEFDPIESLVTRTAGGGCASDGNPEKIIPPVRQAVEMGADVIKADPTDDVADYDGVIEAAGDIPVLVRGGQGRGSGRA